MRNPRKLRNGERGQVLILCVISMLVLLLFVGLAIDFGLAYVKKASLGKAVDAAALTGAKALYLGQTQATAVAQSSFAMNYGSSYYDAAPPILNVSYSPDGTLINVNATATIKTFFIRLLPSFQTLPVAASAQATRAHVIMTLVLDKSYSMGQDGGGAALPGAVNSFLSHFDDTLDSVAVVSFSSTVFTDLAMQTGNFKSAVQSATSNMAFNGHTFSDGGLQQAIIQNNKLSPTGNVIKVVVFFTDGYANMINDNLVCIGTGDKLYNTASVSWNYGGYSPSDGGQGVGFVLPTDGSSEPCHFTGGNNCCSSPGTFPATASNRGTLMPISQTNVNAEAEARAILDSNNMRDQNMVVYSIGLGTPSVPATPSTPAIVGTINEAFLQQIANDPLSSTYNSNKLVGEADFAPTPAQMQAVFDKLAYKILLRLTQ